MCRVSRIDKCNAVVDLTGGMDTGESGVCWSADPIVV